MSKTGGILLCAGLGSRLSPLTDVIPKPAIPFCGVPMAWYARHSLEKAGVCALGMNVFHLPERMIAAMDRGKWQHGSMDIKISSETQQILGTGGGAAKLAAMMPDCERFIVYHGDVLCGVDLKEALSSHLQSRKRVTLVVLPRPDQVKENVRQSLGMIGVVNEEIVCIRDWWKNGMILDSYAPRCFAGIHIVERSVLDEIPIDRNTCLVTQIYRAMLERGEPIHAFEPAYPVFFADVGTPMTYLEAQSRCLSEFVHPNTGKGCLERFDRKWTVISKDGVPSVIFGADALPSEVEHIGENVCIHLDGDASHEHLNLPSTLNHEMICREGGIRMDGAWISYSGKGERG